MKWYKVDVSVCAPDEHDEEAVRDLVEDALARYFGRTGTVVRDADEETD